jgi:archaemetzincin
LTIEINGKETSVDASDFIKEAPGLEDAKYIYPIRTRHCHEYDEDKAWKNEKQYKTSDVLSMLADLVPEDAFCMCSVTMCDLFAGKTDSFTGGMAAGGSRVGVFSMCRYDPSFRVRRKKRKTSNKLSADQLTLLRRGCKVVVHEIGHMFNIGHCVYYSCCMNGSGHLLEDYAQPIHLCPIDLKKIQVATGCDVWERYRQLLKFYDKYEMNEESEWVRSRFKLADVKE